MLPVSICLTTYNRAHVLPGTLNSILAQKFEEFEVIISDDCSTDATEEVCRDYERKDKRVKYFKNPKNLKMPGNLNSAIRKAKGEYIANLHDGDIYRPDLILKWKNALDAVPSAAFVFNAYEVVLGDGTRTVSAEPIHTVTPKNYIAKHYLKTVSCCVWGTVMARASAYRDSGDFDARYGFISDVEMWLRLSLRYDAAYVNEPIITLTLREESHPYAYASWQHLFWQFEIYRWCLSAYQHHMPEEIDHWEKEYYSLRRKRFLRAMASLLKHRKWDRVLEGFRIWKDADDTILKAMGALGPRGRQTKWYDESKWNVI